MFRNFQELNRSDLDGSRTRAFWPRLSEAAKSITSSLREGSAVWLAEMFKSMFLFYGPNTPAGSPSADARGGFGGSSESSSVSVKHSKLEARIGPGGHGKAGGPEVYSRRGCPSHAPQSRTEDSCIAEASATFPGNQEFFFRFAVGCDSHRFTAHLACSLKAEIHRLSSGLTVSSPQNASGSVAVASGVGDVQDPLPLRVVRLKILGRLLGALSFSPFWISANSNPNIPEP